MSHRGDHTVRGISWGLVVANVALLALAAGAAGWWLYQRHLDTSAKPQAGRCIEGSATLPVTADPDIASAISRLADHYNSGRPVVDNYCAKVVVTTQPSQAIAAALPGQTWDDHALGPRPALWIAQSSRWVQRIRVPDLVRTDPKSLATSPIVLAVPEPLRKALNDNRIGWADLPALQQSSLAAIGLTTWGRLGLALPATDSTLGAVEAVAEVTSGAVPLSDDAADSTGVTAAVAGLATNAPTPRASDPLDSLGSQADLAAADLHAVPTTAHRAQQAKLAAYQPTGTTPLADYPATLLSGNWINIAQRAIADQFAVYLASPDQLSAFADDGFLPPGPPPAPPSKVALDQLMQVLAHPKLGLNTTILVDNISGMATSDGSNTRLANITTALRTQLAGLDAGNGGGLWLADNDTPAQLFKIVDATAPLTDAHRTALDSDLRTVRSTGAKTDKAYAALQSAYQSALTGYTPNLTNSLLFVTSGPNNSSDVTDAQLLSAIAAAADKTKPVRIDVVVISDTDSPAMQTLAHNTGGTYARLSTSDTPGLSNALGTVLAS